MHERVEEVRGKTLRGEKPRTLHLAGGLGRLVAPCSFTTGFSRIQLHYRTVVTFLAGCLRDGDEGRRLLD